MEVKGGRKGEGAKGMEGRKGKGKERGKREGEGKGGKCSVVIFSLGKTLLFMPLYAASCLVSVYAAV